MPDDSPSSAQNGRTFWQGLRNLLFGDDADATLREEVLEALRFQLGLTP